MTRKVIRISGEAYKLAEKWNKIRNKRRAARNQEELSVGEEADALIATAASRLGSLAKDAEKNRSSKKGAAKPRKAKKATKKATKKAGAKKTAKRATKPRTSSPKRKRPSKKKGGSKLSALANRRSNGASARA